MSHSEKVCRMGSLALAPIVVIAIIAAFAGISGGIIWVLTALFPNGPVPTPPHSVIFPVVMLTIMGCLLTYLFSTDVYPWLYKHCRGSELMAKLEALENERRAAYQEYSDKAEAIQKRVNDLLAAERAAPL